MLRETYISNYSIDLEMNKKCLRMAIMEKYQQRKLNCSSTKHAISK